MFAAQLLCHPTHVTVQTTFVLPGGLWHLPFSLSPSYHLSFAVSMLSECLLACFSGGYWCGGTMVLTATVMAKKQLPHQIPPCSIWAADSPCVIIVLLGDVRSNVSFDSSKLAIQERQDSFKNSECADNLGYVNNENKSCFFYQKNEQNVCDLWQKWSASTSGPHLLKGMWNHMLGSSACVPLLFEAFWIMED